MSETVDRWQRAAAGWRANSKRLARDTAPVSQWMVEAIDPQPGQHVLELAAGPGETGFLAAELLHPAGKLISTDFVEEMVAVARDRAAELGLDNVEFKEMDAQWIDLPAASLDAVLCRFGYMVLPDPGAALRETRRVLRQGGRVALAAWTAPKDNPWLSAARIELVRLGFTEPPPPDEPGPFAFSEPGRVATELADAGFVDPVVETIDFSHAYDDLDQWWDTSLEMSPTFYDAVASLTPAQRDELRDATDARLAPYVAEDGSATLPARTWVACAEA